MEHGTKCSRGHQHLIREAGNKRNAAAEFEDHFQSVFSCSCDTCTEDSSDVSVDEVSNLKNPVIPEVDELNISNQKDQHDL